MTGRLRAVGVLICASLAGCRAESRHDKPATPVRVHVVQAFAGDIGVRYSAVVEPKTRVDLAFKAGGYVAELAAVRGSDGALRPIQEGDAVRRGMVLSRVRDMDYQVKVRAARSQLAEAEAGVAHARLSMDRAEILFGQKSLAKPDYDAARAAYETVQAKVQGARALVQEAENALADTVLRSPLDGFVVRRHVEVGSLVGPGTPGFTVADASSVKVVFGAPDVRLSSLTPGSIQRIRSEAFPGVDFTGRIARVSRVADPRSHVFDVEVAIPNRDGRLKPGMVASLAVAGDRPIHAGTMVPLGAIVRSLDTADGYAVFVVEDRGGTTTARLRNVTLGDIIGNLVTATGGLKEGDRVIVDGATLVADGEVVKLLE